MPGVSEPSPREARPELGPGLTGAELKRWYWLRAELADLAHRLGVSAAGSKDELTARLVAALDRESPPSNPITPRRTSAGPQLSGVLTPETVIPPGQRSSQALRRFFEERVGPSFRFDGAMRAFIRDHPGATLGDALAHWRATRSSAGPGQPGGSAIAPQFELNRFTRQWYLDHPGGTRAELRAAWQTYRETPTDARPRA